MPEVKLSPRLERAAKMLEVARDHLTDAAELIELAALLHTEIGDRPGSYLLKAMACDVVGDGHQVHALVIEHREGAFTDPEDLPSPCPEGPHVHDLGGGAFKLHGAAPNPDRCNGHPAGSNDPMGVTVYCDGSCRPLRASEAPAGESIVTCPLCGERFATDHLLAKHVTSDHADLSPRERGALMAEAARAPVAQQPGGAL